MVIMPTQLAHYNLDREQSPLYKNGHPDKTKIARFIGCKDDAVNTSQQAARIPWVLQKKAQEIAEICELVAQDFNGDWKKTASWLQRKSPWLGNIKPVDLILCDRCEQLKQFVLDVRNGHMP